MRKLIAVLILVIGISPVLMAHGEDDAPEINLSTGISALVLVAGTVLISRGRRKVQS
jgi:hypothetical protein